MPLRFMSLPAAALLMVAAESSRAVPPAPAEAPPVRVMLSADQPGFRVDERFHLAVVFEIEPQWHAFWQHPGGTGHPPEFRVTAPEGFSVGAPRFSRPEVVRGGAQPTYGYRGETVVFLPVQPPAQWSDDHARFRLKLIHHAGREEELVRMESDAELLLVQMRGRLDLTDGEHPHAGEVLQRIRRAWSRLPRPMDSWRDLFARVDGDLLVVDGATHGFDAVRFVPAQSQWLRFGRPTATRTRDRFTIRVAVEVLPRAATDGPSQRRGLVLFGRSLDDPAVEVDVTNGRGDHDPASGGS